MEEMMVCEKCGLEKSIDDYYYYDRYKFLSKTCKSCCSDRIKLKQKEKMAKETPEEKEKRKEKNRSAYLKKKIEIEFYNKMTPDEQKLLGEKKFNSMKNIVEKSISLREKYQKDYREKNKYKIISERLKEKVLLVMAKGNKCEKCNRVNLPLGLWHFHHNDPKDKVGSIRELKGEERQKEINKCSLLCPECHALHHLAKEYHQTALDFLRDNPQWDL